MRILQLLCIFAALVGICGLAKKRQSMCKFLANPGPCKEKLLVYGYDGFDNECVPFLYGGCGGNPNRFNSSKQCQDACQLRNPNNETELEELEQSTPDSNQV